MKHTELKPEAKIVNKLIELGEEARRGHVAATDNRIREIRQYAERAGITLTEEQETAIAGATKTALVEGIGVKLVEAGEEARRGHVAATANRIREIRQYAERAGITLTEEQETAIATIQG